MHDETTIGARLKALRRWRGLTLEELGGLAGLDKSFLSRAERGQRSLDRRSHIAALATALQVSEHDLVGGPHLTADPVQSEPHRHIPALRVALETNGYHSDPVVEHARPLADLAALMAGTVERERRRYNYLEVGRHLPDLIDELHWHAHRPADEAAHRLALETLVEAYMCAAGMARSLQHPNLGHIAAMRADETAVLLDDPLMRGKAAFALLRPNAGNWPRVQALTERAVDRLDPHVRDDRDVPVLGMLTLSAALACAASRDLAAADHWLEAAADLATRVPDDLDGNWQAFSATNVKIWRITVGVEAGKAGSEVTALAEAVDEGKLDAHLGRKMCYLADVGRGVARDPRRRAEAIHWLRRSEQVAPQRFRNDGRVRETVAVMLEQARIASQVRELRGLAARMGVPH